MHSIPELQKLDIKELQNILAKARTDLYKIQLALRTEKSHKPSEVSKNKKYIAKILTVLNEKTI